MFTVADLFEFAFDVALTVTGAVGGTAGAVYRPLAEIAPQSVPVHPVLERLHVTEVSVDPLTDAVNCCVIVTAIVTALLGVSETWISLLLLESPPPQPASKSRPRDTRNAQLDLIRVGISPFPVRPPQTTALPVNIVLKSFDNWGGYSVSY
jgi:hypothetical protein